MSACKRHPSAKVSLSWRPVAGRHHHPPCPHPRRFQCRFPAPKVAGPELRSHRGHATHPRVKHLIILVLLIFIHVLFFTHALLPLGSFHLHVAREAAMPACAKNRPRTLNTRFCRLPGLLLVHFQQRTQEGRILAHQICELCLHSQLNGCFNGDRPWRLMHQVGNSVHER